MKKILLALAIATMSVSAYAQHRHYQNSNSRNWVTPAIIGGILGYALANNHAEAAPTPPPVMYYPQPNVVYICPFGYRPIINRFWTTDRWGRAVMVENFIGCQ